MTTPPPTRAIPNKYSISLFLALIAAGLVGNYFRYPIFLNIDFLFGSIFSMLALQFFGFGRGVLAATLIAGYTYFAWNHPYAIIIMTVEVGVVGWLMRRRKMGMVLADTLFWLIVGMPLVYLLYHLLMHVPPSNTYIVMTKQAVNGIANALVARLLFTGYALRSRSELISYREIVYNQLAFFVLIPVLIMLAISSRIDFMETDLRIRTSLIQESGRLSLRLKTWVSNRKSAILNLAEMAASRSPQQMQSYLELTKKSSPNFQRVGLADREATTVAFSPLTDEMGKSTIGVNFADRQYFPILKQTLKPMLSEVFMSRIGTSKPIVLMLAPIIIRGEFDSYVIGVLNLDQIQEYLDKSTHENAMLYTLLDKNGKIIMTNHADQTVMKPLVHAKGTLNNLDDKISQWVPTLPRNTPISERWTKSNYITEVAIGNLAEWKLILEQPVAPFQKLLYGNYTGKLSLLFLILLGSLAVAELSTRRAVVTLKNLGQITRDIPVRLEAGDTEIVWPESGIKETNLLIYNFRGMTEALAAVFKEKRHQNLVLEQQVVERTSELGRAKEVAEAANLAKSRFLSIVAHEFQTPLHLLTISTDILDRYGERLSIEEQLEQHKQIRNAARQMSTLIDSVSSVNRQENTVYSVAPVLLDIAQACSIISDEVNTVWGKDHDFNVSISSDCGTGMLDETLFRRILENLLTNAFRFTPAGGRISLNVDRQGDRLQIEVADSGIGIPEVDQERIFEAFYRSSNVDARKGLGLGLSIVSEALQELKGSITLTSRVGVGSTFRVELPLNIRNN